ncbi:MAG: tRNA pseudouridine(38-40) synthase TruA [Acidaminococcaceae bacterium]|nr:tRNA pseudouridine(38-40) synthase TruA [Acidaminococcaceae bacterium]
MRNIKLIVAYVGTAYHGFQKQPGGGTIQDVLEEFLSRVCGEPVRLAGSGRTDAGVHAKGQVVSFRTNGSIPAENIPRAALGLLPPDIAILKAEEADEDFHARFSAKSKEYSYVIANTPGPNPLLWDRRWFVGEKLDLELMGRGAEKLLGKHDFANFCSAGSEVSGTRRTVTKAEFFRQGEEITFAIAADGFLYHMVRNIVWALVQVGSGRWNLERFADCIDNPGNGIALEPAPAGGLYLEKVNY